MPGRVPYLRSFSPPPRSKHSITAMENPIIRTTGEHNATIGTGFLAQLDGGQWTHYLFGGGVACGAKPECFHRRNHRNPENPGYHRVFVKAMNEHGTGSSEVVAIVVRPHQRRRLARRRFRRFLHSAKRYGPMARRQ